MGWNLDREKVRSQYQEAAAFLRQAKGDEPAGLENLLGRPFRNPQYPDVPPARIEPQSSSGANYYLYLLSQLYEADVIDPGEFETLRARLYNR